ncbi:LPS export ABC transporter ATP-binding protein [bacterium]|nr:LPS export ABC transporter ATP-binding protein [bacterium]
MLKAINLQKAFGKTVAVKDISLQVSQGEIVGLLGPNGAGKTTTFEMLLGFMRQDKGSIILDKEDISWLPVWRRARAGMLYLPQEIALFNKLSVEDNIRIILEEYYKDKKKIDDIIKMYLDKVGLYQLRKHIAGTLSGGEKRRLEIGRSLTLQPKFFLLDEPFSGIDPKTVSELQDTIVELKNQGIGILLTDHNVRDTLGITDRAYLIYDGKILVEGTSKDILEHPDSRKVYLGDKFEM